jgi:peptidoglycan/xylan/chitin deacetylase (PgdA/CDA1 family)
MKNIISFSGFMLILTALSGVFSGHPVSADDFSYNIQKVPYSRYLDSGTLTVIASFDGSKSLERWKDILEFAKDNKVKFTFFISGVYFIPTDEKNDYTYPVDPSREGVSDIGFGGASTDVVKRKEFVIQALKEGHDIETHLNGHFDGSRWTEDDWRREFNEFNEICSFLPAKVRHVRFPLLAMNHKVFPAMIENNIYSVNSVVESDYEKFDRITVDYKGKPYTVIQFPIPYGHEYNTSMILMDYNFYLFDEIHHINMMRSEGDMVRLYLEEVEKCLRENRPFFISHHFSNWNNSAYWNAMKLVITTVKEKYPVKFLTISELYDIVN